MTTIKRSVRRVTLVCAMIFALAIGAVAQPGSPQRGVDPDEAPISGIEWLLLGGGLLGARKAIQRFKKN